MRNDTKILDLMAALKESLEANKPDAVRFWYMRDDHTFKRLRAATVEGIAAEAAALVEGGTEYRYGMLCSATLLKGENEIRRVGLNVHAKETLGDTTAWIAAHRDDPDVIRLLEAMSREDAS